MSKVEETIKIPGYTITKQIYAGTRTWVYRGIREKDRAAIVLKLMQKQYPSFGEIVQFSNQYTIAKNLELPGVVKPLSLEVHQNRYVLVMLDEGGISLQEYAALYRQGVLPLDEFLAIAIQITSILKSVHHAGIIHKDIKPANILIDPQTKQIQLIDFSIASLLAKETQTLKSPKVLEGTLAYLSPEQTGRMNRVIDYRSDLYSLGITFYELLTGQLPFVSDDVMTLVHCHIAKLAIPVDQINPKVPTILAQIVNKLISKNAEDRYQSLFGLKFDLELCLSQLQTHGEISNFKLGQRDISERFIIPEKLYGREKEVAELLQAFNRVTAIAENTIHLTSPHSHTELILVAGFSGIGKTAVINEIHKPILERRGYFIKGKYDQFQRDIPFSAIVQALRCLMRQLLSESDSQFEQFKKQITEALSPQAQVIIDVIPELELIIGKQPPAPQLSGIAAQNRFNLLFYKFLTIFTKKEHPLVIFLDDLQWADSASLKLIQMLMTQRDPGYLLIVGAYRDNEVSAAHPLMLTLDDISSSAAKVNTITLAPLTECDLNNLVADTLKCTQAIAQPLTELVYQKTKGNPFFSTQFLKTLHEEGLISFNFHVGYWECDIAKVRELALTDDVVEFMSLQLQKLPLETQTVLKLAACIGNEFDLETLSIIYEKSLAETAADMWKVLQEGLIIPTSEIYKFYQNETTSSQSFFANNSSQLVISYKFLHDRVQQAAYSLIPDDRKQSEHHKIGQILLNSITIEQRHEKIFQIVNHLNISAGLITDILDSDNLAELNKQAGYKAKSSTAYAAAAQYFNMGVNLLALDGWDRKYDLTFELHKELAEVEYLSGNFERAEKIIVHTLSLVKSPLDRAKIYNLLIIIETLKANYAEAIKIGRIALDLLGITLPENNLKAALEEELAQVKQNLGDRQIATLVDIPNMDSDRHKIAIQILKNIDPPAYFLDLELYSAIVVKSVNISLEYGNAPESPKGYATYGLLLGSVLGDYQAGYEFGLLALNVSEKFENNSQKCQVCVILHGYLSHWVNRFGFSEAFSDVAYRLGLESGDLQFAGYALIFKVLNRFHQGIALEELLEEIPKYLAFCSQTKNQWAIDAIMGCEILSLNLSGRNGDQLIFANKTFDEAQYLSNCQKNGSFSWLCTYYIIKAKVLYLLSEYSAAKAAIEAADPYLTFILGHFAIAENIFYTSLIITALYQGVSEDEQQQYWYRLETNQEQLKKWADNCPENFLHKYLIVQAEISRIQNQHSQAIDFCDRAISLAQENKFPHEEALANELAARLYLELDRERIAQAYITEAYYCYTRWGAASKVHDLETLYPQLLAPILED